MWNDHKRSVCQRERKGQRRGMARDVDVLLGGVCDGGRALFLIRGALFYGWEGVGGWAKGQEDASDGKPEISGSKRQLLLAWGWGEIAHSFLNFPLPF